MRGILDYILHGKNTFKERESQLHVMPVRSYDELEKVLKEHGTPFAAAFANEVNAEEYLKLEKLYEP